ncbi:MAG TPA: efflux RND transporter periplasmic adaptor subunit [Terriglobales bacterium]|jgi:RND family efflux transporter MFP subunit|nr:efflux RND transporter periplasmic adaptor subunit [Terriglobales bacterium]
MAIHRPDSADVSRKLLADFLRELEVRPRCMILAQWVLDLWPGGAAVIYLIEDQESPQWTAKAVAGEIQAEDEAVPFEAGTLGLLAERRKPLLFAGRELAREQYAHLHVRKTLVSLAYVPIMVEDVLIGALEAASFDRPISQDDLVVLEDIGGYAGPGLSGALEYERERSTQLQSISRLTQLYDLEKVFNSILEMDDLLPIVASKFREVFEAQAVNLWLVKDQNELLLMNQEGVDPTVEVGALQKSGEGIAAGVSDSGEPSLISDPEDGALQKRNHGIEEGGIFSLMAAPLVAQEAQVGVVEVINRLDGRPFDDDDLFLLAAVCETAAGALHNASLVQAERKVEILETLVTVSKEITSTLNLDSVLQTVVNGTKAVVPYDRAAIALEQRGKLQVRAVSDLQEIRPGDADVARLRDLLEWAAVADDEIHITQHGDSIDTEREETQAKFAEYFNSSGMHAFYAIPLIDDQGRVGMLSFESADPDFLTEAHLEMIRVLAAQVTVAVRNAELYREVPFIGVLEPILQKKRKFLALEKRRRRMLVGVALAVVVFLAVFPLPLRVQGNATVAPQSAALVQPDVEGVVRSVYVKEGDAVKAGTVLADLQDWDYRSALAAAEAKHSAAQAEMNRALAANDGSEAGVQRVQAEYWAAEVQRARQRLEATHLRSPIEGIVATPYLETFVGRHLDKGDTLAQVINTSAALVDVSIDQEEVVLLKAGETASIKLESFPTRTFKGKVAIVSPASQPQADSRVFFARVNVFNPQGVIRAGMQGQGKVWAGWRPAGYVLLRRPAMWIWGKLWSWFGW